MDLASGLCVLQMIHLKASTSDSLEVFMVSDHKHLQLQFKRSTTLSSSYKITIESSQVFGVLIGDQINVRNPFLLNIAHTSFYVSETMVIHDIPNNCELSSFFEAETFPLLK